MEIENGMITKEQFQSAIKELEAGLRIKGKYSLTRDQFNIYFKYLKDLSYKNLTRAIEIIIKTMN